MNLVHPHPLKNPLLKRYWVEFDVPPPRRPPPGVIWLDGPDAWATRQCGVTAFTLDDALWLVQELVFKGAPIPPIRSVIEDVDVSALDRHVRPNILAPIWRGVWFPPIGLPTR